MLAQVALISIAIQSQLGLVLVYCILGIEKPLEFQHRMKASSDLCMLAWRDCMIMNHATPMSRMDLQNVWLSCMYLIDLASYHRSGHSFPTCIVPKIVLSLIFISPH